MNQINNLLDIYICCICIQPMKSAVSLNPCGHELDEGCANTILSSTKACPICRVNVDSFRPAYITRQAIENLLQNMQHKDDITIHVKRLNGLNHTYKMERDSKAIDLFKRLFADTGIHPSDIRLMYTGMHVSLFSHFSEYIPLKEVEFNFHMQDRSLTHWTKNAQDYPLIFQKAINEAGLDNTMTLYKHFSSLYEEAIDNAMKS